MSTLSYLSQIALSLTVSFALVLISGMRQPTLAQLSNSNSDGYQSNERDPLYGGDGIDLNPMDLMHNASQMDRRSGDDFDRDSQQSITDSAANFRKQQLERMSDRKPQTPLDSTSSTKSN
jgi:uncharacterized protein involved in copper resistance